MTKISWVTLIFAKKCQKTDLMLMPTQELFSLKDEKESKVKHRFSEPLTSEDIVKKIQDAIPKKTRDNNKWALSVWVAWSLHRNLHPENFNDGRQVIPANPNLLNDALMNYWMAHFI